MENLAKILVDSIRANKTYLWFLLSLIAGCIVYAIFSESLIESMYEGKSLSVLNNLIKFQHKHSLEHYLELADYLSIRMLFLLFSSGSFIYLLYLLVFSARKISLWWPVLLFTSICIFLYALNPNHRVYSIHGFYRVGIAYQILNGFIPPPDYLFAGETLRAPWGYPFLVACITYVFNISPFYSCAVINIVSLNLVCWLIYKISQLLIRDQRANVFSAIISIFGITIFPFYLPCALNKIFGKYCFEWRATPAFNKFLDIDGDPVGLVFFCLFLFSTLKIFEPKRIGVNVLFLFAALLGCGFFYPPMYPSMLAVVAAVCILALILKKRDLVTINFRRILLIAASATLSLLLLLPYWIVISSGVKGGTSVGQLSVIAHNALNYFLFSFPVLIIIILQWRRLKSQLQRRPLLIIIIFITTISLCYVLIHLPSYGEYKYLLVSLVILGIIGGIGFDFMRQQRNKLALFLILLLFFVPSANCIYYGLIVFADYPINYVEKGRYIHSLDPEEEELFKWIRRNTPLNSVFVDTKLSIPIYAQRSLYVGIDDEDGQTRGFWSRGYWIKIDHLLNIRHGYDLTTIEKRKNIVKKIYNLPGNATESDVETLFNVHKDVYIVTRENTDINNFKRIDFIEIFQSGGGTYRVYQRKTDKK